jgi:hypothetical protein
MSSQFVHLDSAHWFESRRRCSLVKITQQSCLALYHFFFFSSISSADSFQSNGAHLRMQMNYPFWEKPYHDRSEVVQLAQRFFGDGCGGTNSSQNLLVEDLLLLRLSRWRQV